MKFIIPFTSERPRKPANCSSNFIQHLMEVQDMPSNVSVDDDYENGSTAWNMSGEEEKGTTSSAAETEEVDTSEGYNYNRGKLMAQVLISYPDSRKGQFVSLAPTDHIAHFFTSLEATMRTLSPKLQIEAKAQLSSVMTQLELQNAELLTDDNTRINFKELGCRTSSFSY